MTSTMSILEAAALRGEVARLQAWEKVAQTLLAEKELLEQERDLALHELEREQRSHALHHGTEQR